MIILGELIKIRGSDNYSDTGGPPWQGEDQKNPMQPE